MKHIAILAAAIVLNVGALTHAASTRAALDMVLPEMKFTNVGLTDTIDFLRDVSGSNIHVNWRALEESGVQKDANVNIRLRSVTLRKVLNLILSDASGGDTLSYYVDGGVIEITTKDLADKKMYTKVYPVEDLIMEIPDFDNAPEFNLQQNTGTGTGTGTGVNSGVSNSSGSNGLFGGSGGGYGGGNGNGSGGESNTKSKQQRADELITLIMDIIRPDIWKENGGPASIRFWNGNLIVTAPRSVHEALGGPLE